MSIFLVCRDNIINIVGSEAQTKYKNGICIKICH